MPPALAPDRAERVPPPRRCRWQGAAASPAHPVPNPQRALQREAGARTEVIFHLRKPSPTSSPSFRSRSYLTGAASPHWRPGRRAPGLAPGAPRCRLGILLPARPGGGWRRPRALGAPEGERPAAGKGPGPPRLKQVARSRLAAPLVAAEGWTGGGGPGGLTRLVEQGQGWLLLLGDSPEAFPVRAWGRAPLAGRPPQALAQMLQRGPDPPGEQTGGSEAGVGVGPCLGRCGGYTGDGDRRPIQMRMDEGFRPSAQVGFRGHCPDGGLCPALAPHWPGATRTSFKHLVPKV